MASLGFWGISKIIALCFSIETDRIYIQQALYKAVKFIQFVQVEVSNLLKKKKKTKNHQKLFYKVNKGQLSKYLTQLCYIIFTNITKLQNHLCLPIFSLVFFFVSLLGTSFSPVCSLWWWYYVCRHSGNLWRHFSAHKDEEGRGGTKLTFSGQGPGVPDICNGWGSCAKQRIKTFLHYFWMFWQILSAVWKFVYNYLNLHKHKVFLHGISIY